MAKTNTAAVDLSRPPELPALEAHEGYAAALARLRQLEAGHASAQAELAELDFRANNPPPGGASGDLARALWLGEATDYREPDLREQNVRKRRELEVMAKAIDIGRAEVDRLKTAARRPLLEALRPWRQALADRVSRLLAEASDLAAAEDAMQAALDRAGVSPDAVRRVTDKASIGQAWVCARESCGQS